MRPDAIRAISFRTLLLCAFAQIGVMLSFSFLKTGKHFFFRGHSRIKSRSLHFYSKDVHYKVFATSSSVESGTYTMHNTIKFPSTVIVRDIETARKVLKVLEAHPTAVWGCDTEVADIDVKTQSPVGNGKVTCVSIFGGPEIDFGVGKGSALWIENIGEAEDILQEFKGWFEDKRYRKVWHNYGFDRHVMYNEGIDCHGLHGDTMHMARCWDTSRDKIGGGEGYSLESLSAELIQHDDFAKISMKEIFGVGKLKKDGTESKIKDLPDVRELQTNELHREKWIHYSVKDAVSTWWVHYELEKRLKLMHWIVGNERLGNMYEYYTKYLVDFADCLTDMERNGIRVDTKGHLKQAEELATADRAAMLATFEKWIAKWFVDAKYINTASTTQMQQLFFGHYEKGVLISSERVFKISKEEAEFEEEKSELKKVNPYAQLNASEIKKLLKERGIKAGNGKKADLIAKLINDDTKSKEFDYMDDETIVETCKSRGLEFSGTREDLINRLIDDSMYAAEVNKALKTAKEASTATKPKSYREITIKSLEMTPVQFTPAGTPQVSAAVLRKLAGSNLFGDEKDAIWGAAYDFFGGGDEGAEACRAIGALANIGQIDSTITNFLKPLQALVDDDSRIHCSLNLNTETGRLSSRRPNLQNQPALEKDQYKIRDAFVASPGNTLIVADYGQLELRLLAHITSCTSMIDAFRSGGCFHSRTAVGMYDYIRKAVDNGEVLLEWDYSKGQPTVPLVKDTYGSERRKAKTLNFSIAYGKTVHGLAADWGISTEEAEKTLAAWYNDRPEVKKWQEETRTLAKKTGYVRTLMGRYRKLSEASGRGPSAGHALRAAINTPIQGSAADVVIMCMIRLWKSEVLKKLGWKLLLQIHDEVILEGPKENVSDAMAEVRSCMEQPFDGIGLKPLSVFLDVDAKSADSWYKAK